MINVGINGFGRIGRLAARILMHSSKARLVMINDMGKTDALAHLLKYDTAQGRMEADILFENDHLIIDGKRVYVHADRDPANIPWAEHGVELVLECTGKFRSRENCQPHLESGGAKKVVISAPGKGGVDATVVMGVNDNLLKPDMTVVSCASCTTNCLAPVAKVLNDAFGIRNGFMTTVHAYTSDQRIHDNKHSDLRRARAAAQNMVPTTTGAAAATGVVLPELNGKLHGMAVRVPIITGSLIDLVVDLNKDVSPEEINQAMQAAAEGPMKGILQYTDEPLVSSDIIGNPHSSIFDSLSTVKQGDNLMKVLAWYDNEFGYASRLVQLAEAFGNLN
ncbi:MAG: type I glyceraldehyde-3-phosphate dehydrogenase [Bacteroidota bacterium]